METSGFFNSSDGDRLYDAADFASYFGKIVSNGIFYASATNLQVSAGTGMEVDIAAGAAWINGYSYENTDTLALTLDTAHGVFPRIDRIVVRWSAVDREIKLAVITGVPTATPDAPALTRNNDIYELCIAEVIVPQAAASIEASDITDTRLDGALCGLVNSLVSAVYE
jgi:hypothetical protein